MALHIDTFQPGLLAHRATLSTDTASLRSVRSAAKADATISRGHIIVSEDGTPLLLRYWLPDKAPRAQLLMVHDYFEHGDTFEALAQSLAPQRIGCHALDLRGHGISSGVRGHVRTLTDYSDDIQASLNALPAGPQFLLGVGHSGLCALDFVAQRRPSLQGLIVIEPQLGQPPQTPIWQHRLMHGMGWLWPRVWVPKRLWPSVGFARHVREPAPPYTMLEGPLSPKHMTYAWWRDVPRIQARVGRLAQLSVPLLCIDDVNPEDTAAGPAQMPTGLAWQAPQKRVRRLRVAQGAARLRAGEADTALVDAVVSFIRRRHCKRVRQNAFNPTTGAASTAPAALTSTLQVEAAEPPNAAAGPCMAWCEGLAQWPTLPELVSPTSIPGAYPS